MKNFNFIKNQGFTIVELLIVIVVISILASITVVAFNGVQDRAKNAQLLSSFDAMEKAMKLYYINEGTLPPTSDSYLHSVIDSTHETAIFACVGKPSDYPATANFKAGECWTNGANGEHVIAVNSPTISSAFDKYVKNISVDASNELVDSSVSTFRGMVYSSYTSDHTSSAIMYAQKGDASCGRGEKVSTPPIASAPNGGTMCAINMRNGVVVSTLE